MKNRTLILSIIFIISCFCVFILFVISKRINDAPNGFKRISRTHFLNFQGEFKIELKSWLMAGASSSRVYLRNKKYANLVLELNRFNLAKKLIAIKRPEGFEFKFPIIAIDSPLFRIVDAQNACFFEGKVGKWKPEYKNKMDLPFSTLVAFDSVSFAVQILDLKKGMLLAAGSKPNNKLRVVENVLKKHQSTILANDGMLVYNKAHHRAIYMYYYKNQFAVLDATLKPIYYGKTIDTVSKANVQLSRNGEVLKLSTPTIPASKYLCSDGIFIYLQSSLKADNDISTVFSNSSAIDVYDLENGKYKFSFFIPDYRSEKMHQFKVVNDNIYVLYDSYLVVYKIKPKYAH